MCVLIFVTILFGTFLILRRIQGDIVINVNPSSCKVSLPVVIEGFSLKLNFFNRFSKKAQI